MIPSFARHNFEITPNDTKQQVLAKRYLLEKDRIKRLTEAEERLKAFDLKYGNLTKMKNKTNIEKLKQIIAVESFLNE
jgi:hypothetical protein